MMMRFNLFVGLVFSAGIACAAPLVDGDIESGAELSAQCVACHGPQGNMQSGQFPKLAGQGSPYIYQALQHYKSGARENAIMAGQAAGLSDQDMKDLAVYFASQQTSPSAASIDSAPAGAELYHSGDADRGVPACSGCHGPAGLGNEAAAYPRISWQSAEYISTQLQAYRGGGRDGYRAAQIMTGVAENLSDADIQALSSYVAGLGPNTGEGGRQYGALMRDAELKSPAADAAADSMAAPEGTTDVDAGASGSAAGSPAGTPGETGSDDDRGAPESMATEVDDGDPAAGDDPAPAVDASDDAPGASNGAAGGASNNGDAAAASGAAAAGNTGTPQGSSAGQAGGTPPTPDANGAGADSQTGAAGPSN